MVLVSPQLSHKKVKRFSLDCSISAIMALPQSPQFSTHYSPRSSRDTASVSWHSPRLHVTNSNFSAAKLVQFLQQVTLTGFSDRLLRHVPRTIILSCAVVSRTNCCTRTILQLSYNSAALVQFCCSHTIYLEQLSRTVYLEQLSRTTPGPRSPALRSYSLLFTTERLSNWPYISN